MMVVSELARSVCATTSVTEAAHEAALRSIADLVTSVVAGQDTQGGRAAIEATVATFGAGPAPIWFRAERSTVTGATYANAAVACMLDLDDGHRAAAGHPGAAVIPAVLAEAARRPVPLPRLLAAVAIGYEVGIRLSRARDFATLDTTATGRWCGVGAAAALGWLRRVPEPVMAQALGIAAGHAPNMNRAGVRSEAGHVKEGIAWGTATGVAALEAAAAGFTGSLSPYDDGDLYDADAILGAWGEGWLIEGTYYKPYSCCRWAHAALDGLAALLKAEPVQPERIEAIEVDLFSRALTLNNLAQPPSLEAAQYSIPYVLGLLAVHGAAALLPMQPGRLDDPRVIAVARRVVLRVDSGLDAMFPAQAPGRITLQAGGRRRICEVRVPWGEPANPMGWADLREKQRQVCAGHLDAARLWEAIEAMRAGDIDPLLSRLATPLATPLAGPAAWAAN